MIMKARSLASTGFALLLVFASFSTLLAADAAQIYKARCSACHGADGSGNTPMGKKAGARALGSEEVQKQSDAALTKSIAEGKGKMPAYSTKLTADDIAELVKFIRTMAN
jgi:cytochrome c6